MHTVTDETLHTEDPLHTEVFPGMAADPDHVHHTNTTTRLHQNHMTAPTEQSGRTKERKYKQVTTDDPPSQYYSCDEQASESDKDLK